MKLKEKLENRHLIKKISPPTMYRHCNSKGVGTTVGSIIMIVVFLMFFGVFLYMANNHVQENIRLNLESLQLLKLKSTFETFNQSLGVTWFISTVQSVFKTADDSVGCGIDDGRVPASYWLKTDPTQIRDKPDKILATKEEKYNVIGTNPQICFPQDNHIVDYITTSLAGGDYLDLKNPIKDLGGVDLEIKNPKFGITIDSDQVTSKFSQDITAKLTNGNGEIAAKTGNFNTMTTSIKVIVESIRATIERLVNFGEFMYTTNTVASYTPLTQNEAEYVKHFSSVIEGLMRSPSLTNIDQKISVKTEVTGVDDTNSGVFDQTEGHGLVVHYIAKMTYTEVAPPTSSGTALSWPTDSKTITSCYGPRESPLDESNQFHEGLDIAGSANVGENVYAVADGTVLAAGKICTKGDQTCSGGYGNSVLIEHSGFFSFYAHLESVSVKAGDRVSQGAVIGITGDTGRSTGVHLHFEIRTPDRSTRVNPCEYLDCSQSTGKTCESTPAGESGTGYYYNDKLSGIFYKRPVSLQYSVEDYLPAIDCRQYTLPPPGRSKPVFFNWQVKNDMACCAGFLLSCNVAIPKLSADQSIKAGSYTSENLDCDNKDVNSVQCICNGVLLGNVLKCDADGFSVAPPP